MLTRIKLALNLPLTKEEALSLTHKARIAETLKYNKLEIKRTLQGINLAIKEGKYFYKTHELQPSTVQAVEALGYAVNTNHTTHLTYYIVTWD